MPRLTRAALLEMVTCYEETLRRIVGKPNEQEALLRHLGNRASDDDEAMMIAFRKTGRIAYSALRQFHPNEPL